MPGRVSPFSMMSAVGFSWIHFHRIKEVFITLLMNRKQQNSIVAKKHTQDSNCLNSNTGSISNCMTLGRLCNHSVPQSPHL